MFRKFTAILLSILLFSCLYISAAAAANSYIIDNADILQSSEEQALSEIATDMRREYGMDIVILSVSSLGGESVQTYADDFLDSGYEEDGILFLLAMEEREWYISTSGNGIMAVTDYGIQQVSEEAVWYFSDGSYYEGFKVYLTELTQYLRAYQNGTPIDGYADYSREYYHGTREEVVYYEKSLSGGSRFLIALVVGLASAAISILVMRGMMNTKRPQRSAEVYLNRGSYHLHTHSDMFLYSNIHKVRRQQNTNSGNRGGGSSVHRSSDGRRHGGGGGRF